LSPDFKERASGTRERLKSKSLIGLRNLTFGFLSSVLLFGQIHAFISRVLTTKIVFQVSVIVASLRNTEENLGSKAHASSISCHTNLTVVFFFFFASLQSQVSLSISLLRPFKLEIGEVSCLLGYISKAHNPCEKFLYGSKAPSPNEVEVGKFHMLKYWLHRYLLSYY
jgi:hypothetical protein